MTTKRELKARIADLEMDLATALGPPLTMRTLTVCWPERWIELDGRRIPITKTDCVSIPILGTEHLIVTRGNNEVIP